MWAMLVLALAASLAEPPAKTDAKEEPKQPKIAATCSWRTTGKTPVTFVIRTPEEAAVALGVAPAKAKDDDAQKEATAQLAKQFKVEKIDWQKQMVVVTTVGAKPTGGFSIEFTGLEVKDKTLTVKWKLKTPTGVVPQLVTYPGGAALIERFDGEVKFDPPAPKEKDK